MSHMPLESWLDYGKFWLPAELRRFARTSVFFSLKLRLKENGRRLFQEKYNTHHVNPVEDGGDVYNLDTLAIAAPKTHAEAHAEIDEKKKEDKGCKEG